MKVIIDKYQRQIVCEQIGDKLICQINGIQIEYKFPYPNDEKIKETFEKMTTEDAVVLEE
jgi:hypothetical protein